MLFIKGKKKIFSTVIKTKDDFIWLLECVKDCY